MCRSPARSAVCFVSDSLGCICSCSIRHMQTGQNRVGSLLSTYINTRLSAWPDYVLAGQICTQPQDHEERHPYFV